MDGGRVLRATLWYLGDEMLPATRVAAQVGRICGMLLGAGGVALAVFARAPFFALWAALIGYFLHRTASSSYRQLLLQTALDKVRVADLMQRRFRAVPRELNLEQFVARYVLGQAETGFAVVAAHEAEADAPVLIGMITLRNLRRYTTAQWSGHLVSEAMTPLGQIRSVGPLASAIDALYMLNDGPDDLLPVTDGQRLVGILRRRDLAVFIQVQMARRGRT
jgi:CBS domain-containing protein